MAVIKFLVYMTCFCFYQVFCDNYGESGSKITLTPTIHEKPEEILWTHDGNKVLEYDGSEVAKYGLFKDRVEVDFETGQLTIIKLNSQDSGKYHSEILISGKVQTSSHTLTILDALPEPRVTCELNETSNLKKLSCSVESQTQPSYEWSGPDIKQPGPTLLVDGQEEKQDSVYTCTVKNKVANRTIDFTLQDCHTVSFAVGASPAVLVPVIIVAVLLIILLAMLALYFYRRKKQKLHAQEAGEPKLDPENGECDSLLRNVSTKAMSGSPDATLPCHTRLTAPKESIADKKWDRHSESENLGETHEGQKLLKASPQSAITEKNKEDTGNTNEGELDKNEKNSEYADEVEENANSKPDETDREIESQKSLQTQEEREKESPILKNDSENEENSSEEQIETLGEQKTEDADKNEEDQIPADEKGEEEENTVIDSPNTGESDNLLRNVSTEPMPGSPDATLPCRTRLTAPKEFIADKKWDRHSESESSLQTQEERGKESPKLRNGSENEENSSEEQIETLGGQKTEDAAKNGEDQTPRDEKEEKEENTVIDSPNTGSPDATLPCHTRPNTPKESITDKKWDQDSESENAGETHEGQKLLKTSPQSTITGKNNDDTGNTNEGELDKNEKSSEYADEVEENANSKPDETDREIESQNSSQTQDEMEKETSQIQKNEEKSPKEQTETLRDQDTDDANKNEEDQTSGEKKEKEEENKEIDSPNTGSPDGALNTSKESTANKKCDQESGSKNAGDTHEGQKHLKASSQSAITEKNKEDAGNTNVGEVGQNVDESEGNANSEPDVKQSQKTENADKNKKDQTPEEKKDKEEENEGTDSPNTESPQPAVTEGSTVDTGNLEEQHTNEKNSQNENGEQSPQQQNKSPCTAVNYDDQNLEGEKKLEEKTGKENHEGTLNTAEPFNSPSCSEASSDPVDSPGNLGKDPTNTDISLEKENTFLEVEQKNKENVLTNENPKGGQEQMQEENKHESSEPKNSINLDKQGKQTHPDSTIHDNSVSQQQDHNDGGNSCEAVTASSNITDQEEEDDGKQRVKSESEQDMKENNDVPGNNETKDNQHLIYDKDETNTSVPEDQKTE